MADVEWFTVLVHLVIGGVLLWVGVRGWQGTLSTEGPGIRTPRTLASPEAWRTANRAGAPWLIAAGALAVTAGLLLIPFGGGEHDLWFSGAGTGGAVLLALVAVKVGVDALDE